MDKIISFAEASELSIKLQKQQKTIVLAGGCFDILHIGHLTFLEEAKKHGDILVVLVEADETITKAKGPKRPINTQQDRAQLLAALRIVDFVVLLTPQMDNQAYDNLVIAVKPAIIATTQGDKNRHHKERQAALVGAQVMDVTEPIKDKSTTHVVNLLREL
jgi:rfaE bifunctional protein nucleotidyltransferase chain/domain